MPLMVTRRSLKRAYAFGSRLETANNESPNLSGAIKARGPTVRHLPYKQKTERSIRSAPIRGHGARATYWSPEPEILVRIHVSPYAAVVAMAERLHRKQSLTQNVKALRCQLSRMVGVQISSAALHAPLVQWYDVTLPWWRRGFDSLNIKPKFPQGALLAEVA